MNSPMKSIPKAAGDDIAVGNGLRSPSCLLGEAVSPFRALGKKRAFDCDLSTSSRTPPRSLAMGSGVEDRYIPNRAKMDEDISYCRLTADDALAPIPPPSSPSLNSTMTNMNYQPPYGNVSTPSKRSTPGQHKLKQELSNLTPCEGKRIIDCRKSLTPVLDRMTSSSSLFLRRESMEATSLTPNGRAHCRSIPTQPKKVLDIPNLVNDYYLNLLHWGSNNSLAIALGPTAYLWHPDTGQVDSVMTLEDSDAYISSIQWAPRCHLLAMGTTLNTVFLYDSQQETITRELEGHSNRVAALSWQNNNILTTGGRDGAIFNHDLRLRRTIVSSYAAHTQEVCGLAWSSDEQTLASGGNDNFLCLWDARASSRSDAIQSPASRSLQDVTVTTYAPRMKYDQHHTAAVKALAWCPWQRNLLASGGGTADRTIRMWNTATGENIKCVDTGSQVCAIQWSDHYRELVSSHGFSDFQLTVWKYPDMTKIQELRGHSARVLNLAKSPCGRTICSASTDETLRFWDIFDSGAGARNGVSNSAYSPVRTSSKSPYKPAVFSMGSMMIR
eukprot:gene6781-7491_t